MPFVKGVETMKGAKVRATDLRAGAGLVNYWVRCRGSNRKLQIFTILIEVMKNFDGKIKEV